ncbi:MAG: hypothetical protein CSA74_12125 [Rhodobacterales bacterium]|nr:MAG: hypothetical protein CSA74_12125 [Rhodobacterales bacterium]
MVPKDGPRQRRERDFTIEGANSELISYTYAKLTDGAVKGFMLIWPQGARITAEDGSESYEVDRRRALVLDAMRQSFAPIPGAALPDNAGLDQAEQSIDLVSGLKIRKAERARSGFFVTEQGDVLTTLEAVQNCGSVTLEDAYPANIVATDEQLGLALLRPQTPLAPMAIAELLNFDPRIGSELAVAGFSYGGRLPSPTLTFGTLAETRGLAGETEISRLNVTVQDGDAGGPVLDQGGAVIGMLLAAPTEGKLLPQGVGLTAKGTALAEFLAANGVTATMTQIQGALTPYDLTNNAANMTVLVSCWK